MKTEQEIEKEISKTIGNIESLEHLITEAELGIKMHRKEIDTHSARLRGLKWCLETTSTRHYTMSENNDEKPAINSKK